MDPKAVAIANRAQARDRYGLDQAIASSSMGAAAWCRRCGHAIALHEPCSTPDCRCSEFIPMTETEWLAWRDGAGSL